MSPQISEILAATKGFPRVSGDEPYMPTLKSLVDGFSPRERG